MPSWKVTNRASMTNRPAWTVGGLGPSVGPGAWATRAIQINANGQGPFRFRTFCINQLGNIGGGVRNSMFGSSSDATNGCRDQPCVKAPYCASVGKSLASSQHTLTIGCPPSPNPCSTSSPALGFSLGTTSIAGFGSLSNPIFNRLSIWTARWWREGGAGSQQYYEIVFLSPGNISINTFINQLQSMNISIEVINEQGLSASIPMSPALGTPRPTGPLWPIGGVIIWEVTNQKFMDIVTGTDGPTYTLKIKENP